MWAVTPKKLAGLWPNNVTPSSSSYFLFYPFPYPSATLPLTSPAFIPETFAIMKRKHRTAAAAE